MFTELGRHQEVMVSSDKGSLGDCSQNPLGVPKVPLLQQGDTLSLDGPSVKCHIPPYREYPRVSHSTGSYPPQYPPGPVPAIISPAERKIPRDPVSVCLTSAMCSQPFIKQRPPPKSAPTM